jgi:hypothetical protein
MTGINVLKICRFLLVLSMASIAGCAYQPPTISHVHLGHAVTAAKDTPGKAGYLVVSEQTAEEAIGHANRAVAPYVSTTEMKSEISKVDEVTNQQSDFSLVAAVAETVNHLRFAAETDDSSENVRRSFEALESIAEDIFYRSDLISLYSSDIASSASEDEIRVLAEQVQQLAKANLNGADIDDSGITGDQPKESGVVQFRAEFEAMLEREDPTYVAVDRWYLFNLIRLPSGEWVFKRTGSSGTRGY